MSKRLFVTSLKSIGLVGSGDNPDAEVVIYKSRVDKRKFSTEERKALAESGKALSDGSFPIVNTSDLRNAISSFGRAAGKARARKHIIKRARALGATEMLPETWNVSKMSGSAESALTGIGANVDLSAIEDQELRKSIEDVIAESEMKITDLTKQVEELTPEDPEKAVKDAPEEVQAILKAQEKELAKVREDLAKERTVRRNAEYVEKAKPLSALLGKADEMGPILAELSDKAPDAYAKLESALVAASQRKELAKLFAEMGTGETEGESDPIAKRDTWVEKNRKDDETTEQAKARFWEANPDEKEVLRS